jgi:repressor LexA
MPEALTPMEQRIYNFLIDHLKKETYQPSVREIGSRFGIRSTKTVTEHLQSLQRKGYLDRTPSRSRALRILGLDLSPRTYTIPLYPNADGQQESPETSFDLDRTIACSADCFLVRVNGDHLKERGVSDGDLLLVEPRDRLAAGATVVVEKAGRIELVEGDGDGAGAGGRRNSGRRVLGVARALFRAFD